ncbi:MAG: hypothetical protein OXJ52_10040 [Oligoflexia bacterium]|nr:hypothetical protein [Oligoflexia bacterium]
MNFKVFSANFHLCFREGMLSREFRLLGGNRTNLTVFSNRININCVQLALANYINFFIQKELS